MDKKRILVADDEEPIRFCLSLALEQKGFEVHTAKDGEEALRLAQTMHHACRPFDLLIADIQMPKCTGEELMVKLNELGLRIPVLVITGFDEKELLIRLMRLGCRDFVDKPFEPADIEERIELIFSQERAASLEKKRKEHFALLGEKAQSLIHELTDVLHGTIGYAGQALQEIEASHPARARLETILSSAGIVADICKNLLALKTAAGGPVKLRTELRALVERIAEVLRSIAPDSVTVDTKSPGSPVWLDADAQRLQQALLNLGISALGAMPQGGTMTYELSFVEAARADGIPPERCVRIAVVVKGEAVSGGDATAAFTIKAAGRGYGLHTVREIVGEHNGWIERAGEAGKETDYRLFFPV